MNRVRYLPYLSARRRCSAEFFTPYGKFLKKDHLENALDEFEALFQATSDFDDEDVFS